MVEPVFGQIKVVRECGTFTWLALRQHEMNGDGFVQPITCSSYSVTNLPRVHPAMPSVSRHHQRMQDDRHKNYAIRVYDTETCCKINQIARPAFRRPSTEIITNRFGQQYSGKLNADLWSG